ncbi:hypothetical protein FRC18_003950 [Serendipita sp. 400]|nr:hypothetical protein FRC18_003950 [Serendipita sp. 400]
MPKLPTHQESQEYTPFETEGTRWEPRQLYQQPGHPEFDQENYEDDLYTGVQFGLDYRTQSLHTNREPTTIPNLYDGQDPGVLAHPIAAYPAETKQLTRYGPPHSTLHGVSALLFPTGALQMDGASDDASYRSPIDYTDGFPSLELASNMDISTTRGSADPPTTSAHVALHSAEHSETIGNDEEGEEMTELRYNGAGSWKCTICLKSFRRRRRAILHVLNKHNSIRIPCNGSCGIVNWYVGEATYIIPFYSSPYPLNPFRHCVRSMSFLQPDCLDHSFLFLCA